MATTTKPKWTADAVRALIRARYTQPGRYAVFDEVANGTGLTTDSWIDVAVVYLWPSDGLKRIAFEIKVSRSDFLSELRKPHKNEWAKNLFHEFFYVAPAGVIASLDELPEWCGWLEAQQSRLVNRKAAQQRQPIQGSGDELIPAFARAAQREAIRAQEREKQDLHSLLATDPRHAELLQMEKEVHAFLRKRGRYLMARASVEELAKELASACVDTRLNEKLDEIQEASRWFTEHMYALFAPFCAVAITGLGAANALENKFIEHLADGTRPRYYNQGFRDEVQRFLRTLTQGANHE